MGRHGTVEAVGSVPGVGPGGRQREEREDAASGESGGRRGWLNTQRVGVVADITYGPRQAVGGRRGAPSRTGRQYFTFPIAAEDLS